MSILDDMDNPELFGPFFPGGSFAAWRAFLATIFALPMDDDALALYQHHTSRKTLPAEPFREVVAIAGRRGGKSRMFALLAVFLAMRDYSPFLAPGEIATIPIIAANRDQARTIFRYILGLINKVPELASMKGAETAESVEIGEHVVIEIHTASLRSVRGYTLAAALVDEVAFLRDEATANPDVEIVASLRPGLSSIPGSILLLGSTPYAKRGVLYSSFRRYWGKEDSPVLVWHGTSLEMNPTLNPKERERAFEEDPSRARQEWDAEFRDDVSGFVTREVIEACTPPGRHELPAISSIRYSAFVDPSGGSSDSMTLAIAHSEKGIAILDAMREVRPPFSPEAVVSDFAVLLKTYRVTRVTGDRYAGEWPRERFRVHGIMYDLSDRPASDIHRDILPALNSHQVELLDLPRLTKQYCDLERRTARGGRDLIDHPPKGHDDLAVSASGALLMAKARQPMRISAEAVECITRAGHMYAGVS